jgi:hypothetical protein
VLFPVRMGLAIQEERISAKHTVNIVR